MTTVIGRHKRLWIDTEGFNKADLKEVGGFVYANTAEVILFPYAIDDGPVKLWDLTKDGQYWPDELIDALEDDRFEYFAHNSQFDRRVIAKALNVDIPIPNWRCTMVQALAHALPGKLEQLGKALGLGEDQQKLKDGKKLINRFCKPAPRNHKAERYDRHTHPEEWERFCQYAIQDVDAMRECEARMPTLNFRGSELEIWFLDQKINDRGFAADRTLAEAGARAYVREVEALAAEFRELVDHEFDGPRQRAEMLRFLNDNYNLGIEDTTKGTFETLIKEHNAGQRELEPDCMRIMEISMQANKTSMAKYAAILPGIADDGRYHGGLQYAGASRTRRWSGRGFQGQNLPSKGLPKKKEIDRYTEALIDDMVDLVGFDKPTLYASAALRGVVVAPKGKKLCVSDLSNIEGRIVAWLAEETWKIEAFKAYDRGEGHDLYKVTAGQLIGADPGDVDKQQRNIFGKIPELAFGFGGGVGALQTFARSFSIKIADIWDIIQGTLDQDFFQQADESYHRWGRAQAAEMAPREWIGSEAIKLAWRARHPATAKLWPKIDKAAISAVENPGKTYRAGKFLKFHCKRIKGKLWLLCKLPSGNFLTYYEPRLREVKKFGRLAQELSYMGRNQMTGNPWTRIPTYGGKLLENPTQSIARDVMAENMPAIEERGYEIVLSVHDELLTETPDTDEYSSDELSRLLSRKADWMEGLPLAADGFETYRYYKED